MCGRTVRVPDLDGRIAPLPAPELDHGDRSLAQALDALASLESGPTVFPELEPEPFRTQAVAERDVRIPIVEAVPIEPVDSAPVTSESAGDPLRELASAPLKTGDSPHAAGAENWARKWILPAITGAAGFIIGGLLGRYFTSESSDSPPPKAIAVQQVTEAPQTVPPESKPPASGTAILSGRVTYQTANGEARPDAGARVLVLPGRHPPVAKLAAGSFQSGATPTDLKVARVSIQALGGDFVVTDSEGRYDLRVPSGVYHRWIFSRYQPRSGEDGTEPGSLQDWFDQPQLILGKTQFADDELQIDSGQTVQKDQQFPHAD